MWELETTHVQGGQPMVFQERAPRAFASGFAAAAVRYGLPIDVVDIRFVNDHCYGRIRPIGAPEPKLGKPSKAPPDFVLKVLCRLHPELRRRNRSAGRAVAQRLWLEDLDRWVRGERSMMVEAARSLQAEPLASLDDDSLVAHLRRAATHYEKGMALHFELMPVHDLPVGRLVLAMRRWGFDDAIAFSLLGGCSPASAASAEGLRAIAAACAAAGVAPTTLEDVRAAGAEASATLDRYLADHGWRVASQYSPRARALVEMPGVLVAAIGAAPAHATQPALADTAAVRDRVPVTERAEFDELLADARACYGVRDDNVAVTFMWPAGLVRRALLEAGRRLFDRGLLVDGTHVLALTEDEITQAFAGNLAVADLARARVERLLAAEADGAPARLGDDEGPPPDPGLFPSPMADLLRAIFLPFELESAFQGADSGPPAWTGAGVGIGAAAYTGPACVAASVDEALDRVRAGDVLVTRHTTPAFEAIMPIVGALVTDHGGLMSHAAIVCREQGIPAVVGVAGASSMIPDAAQLTVDPIAGTVVIMAATRTEVPGRPVTPARS